MIICRLWEKSISLLRSKIAKYNLIRALTAGKKPWCDEVDPALQSECAQTPIKLTPTQLTYIVFTVVVLLSSNFANQSLSDLTFLNNPELDLNRLDS